MTAHTPGPWQYDNSTIDGPRVLCEDHGYGNVICNTNDEFSAIQEDEANARLIAAAPDMLAALRILAEIPLEQMDSQDRRPDDHCLMGWNEHYLTVGHVKAARAAIAKATGG